MAEITVQIVLSTLQTVGLLVGIFYYIMTLRNQQKNQRAAKESSQLQTLITFSGMASEEGSRRAIELLKMEWADYNDFEMKYGSDNNPDNYAKRQVLWGQYDTIGLALKKGYVDRDLIFERLGNIPVVYWVKFGEVIKEIRRRYNQPLSLLLTLSILSRNASSICRKKASTQLYLIRSTVTSQTSKQKIRPLQALLYFFQGAL